MNLGRFGGGFFFQFWDIVAGSFCLGRILFWGSVCGYIMCWSGSFSVVLVVGNSAITSRLSYLAWGYRRMMHLVSYELCHKSSKSWL